MYVKVISNNNSEESKELLLSFDQTFEMFMLIGLFPRKCDKLLMQFYFDYVASTAEGLDFDEFKEFLPLIGFEIIKRANEALIVGQIKMKADDQDCPVGLDDPIMMVRSHFYLI